MLYVEQAESADVYFDGAMVDQGCKKCAEIAKSEGRGRKGREVIGSTELCELVNPSLVRLPGRWSNTERLQVLKP